MTTENKPALQITLYKSALCPRCRAAAKQLRSLTGTRANLAVEEVDVLANPLRALRDGVLMIPTLICGRQRLSGIFLDRAKIEAFLQQLAQG